MPLTLICWDSGTWRRLGRVRKVVSVWITFLQEVAASLKRSPRIKRWLVRGELIPLHEPSSEHRFHQKIGLFAREGLSGSQLCICAVGSHPEAHKMVRSSLYILVTFRESFTFYLFGMLVTTKETPTFNGALSMPSGEEWKDYFWRCQISPVGFHRMRRLPAAWSRCIELKHETVSPSSRLIIWTSGYSIFLDIY